MKVIEERSMVRVGVCCTAALYVHQFMGLHKKDRCMEPTKTSTDFIEAWRGCFQGHIKEIFEELFPSDTGLRLAFVFIAEKLWGSDSGFSDIMNGQDDAEIIHLLTLELEFFCAYSPATDAGSGNSHYYTLEKAKSIISSMMALLEFGSNPQYRRYLHILHELLSLAQ